MSHFVKIQTQIREREQLCAALRDLHHEFQVGERLQVRGWQRNWEAAEVVVNTGSKYDVGFRRDGETYEVLADWWAVEGASRLRQKSFIEEVSQQYGYRVVLAQAVNIGWVVEDERTLENGDRVLLLSERG